MFDGGPADGRVLATALILAAVLVFGVDVVGSAYVPGIAGPCNADFAVETDEDGRIAVSLEAGRFTRTGTTVLLLAITDADTGESVLLNWREAGGTYPVTPGDEVAIDESRLPFALDAGDTVEVRWRGPGPRAPRYCPTHQSGAGGVIERLVVEG